MPLLTKLWITPAPAVTSKSALRTTVGFENKSCSKVYTPPSTLPGSVWTEVFACKLCWILEKLIVLDDME